MNNAAGAAHGAAIRVSFAWWCPSCKQETVTHDPKVRMVGHVCPKNRFLSVPMVRKGTKAKIEVREREDYVGKELVTLDPERERPVMSIVTTRDNGQDTAVFAPTARATGD